MSKIRIEVLNELVCNEQILLLSIELNELGYVYENHRYTDKDTVIMYNKELQGTYENICNT